MPHSRQVASPAPPPPDHLCLRARARLAPFAHDRGARGLPRPRRPRVTCPLRGLRRLRHVPLLRRPRRLRRLHRLLLLRPLLLQPLPLLLLHRLTAWEQAFASFGTIFSDSRASASLSVAHCPSIAASYLRKHEKKISRDLNHTPTCRPRSHSTRTPLTGLPTNPYPVNMLDKSSACDAHEKK